MYVPLDQVRPEVCLAFNASGRKISLVWKKLSPTCSFLAFISCDESKKMNLILMKL